MSRRVLCRATLVVATTLMFAAATAHAYPIGYTIGKRAANGTTPLDGEVATVATFDTNFGGYMTSENNLYFVDKTFNTVRLYNGTSKQVSTIAGQSGVFGHADGAPNVATFSTPFATVVLKDPTTSKSVVIVSDQVNGCIRKVPVDGSNVTTLYGVCNGGRADLLNSPADVGVDNDVLFVVDTNNDRILKIDVATGVATVVIQKTNWRPLFLAIANGTYAFVATSSYKLTTANFATGEINDLIVTSNIPAHDTYEVGADLTTWEKDKILYFISKDPVTFIYSLNTYNYGTGYSRYFGKPGEFKNFLNFSQGIKDGENPQYRDVTGMIALSINDVMIRQQTALRGVLLFPDFTDTATMSINHTMTVNHSVTVPHTTSLEQNSTTMEQNSTSISHSLSSSALKSQTMPPTKTISLIGPATFQMSVNLTTILGYSANVMSLEEPLTSLLKAAIMKDIVAYLTSRGYGTSGLPTTLPPAETVTNVSSPVLTPPDILTFNVTVKRFADEEPVRNETSNPSNPWTELKQLIITSQRLAPAPDVHFCRTLSCQWAFSMVGLALILALVVLVLLILLVFPWGRTFLFNCLLLYPILL